MDIRVRNFRNIAAADLSFGHVAIVSGPNMGGKSSLAEAIRAALCADPLPLSAEHRLTKKDHAPQLIRHGAEMATAQVAYGEDASATFRWPRCDYETTGGSPPRSSRVAAGLDSLGRMKPEERARFLVDLLGALPSRDELAAAIKEAGVDRPADAARAVWDIIAKDGWDAAAKRAQAKGAEKKGQWREITGETYGSDKARGWTPTGWQVKWDTVTVEQANEALAALVADLAAYDRQQGTSAAHYLDLKAEADKLADLEKVTLPDVEAAKKAYDDAIAARDALPASEMEAEVACLSCGRAHSIAKVDGKLVLVERETLSEKERKARRMAKAAADGTVSRLKGDWDRAVAQAAAHEAALEKARGAKAALDAIPAPSGETNDAARQEKVAAVDVARRAVDLIARRIRANQLDRGIRDNQALLAILEPDGLRQAKLAEALGRFNGELMQLASWMGVPPVVVTHDMLIDRIGEDGTPMAVYLLSASEQFRARIMLQAAVAKLDGSHLMVIDNEVDQDTRWVRGTLNLLLRLGIPAVLTLRADRMDTRLDLSRMKPAGRQRVAEYWIGADGIVVAAEPVPAREAA